MHELALIKKIIENAEHAAKKANISKVKTLRMRIGQMAGFKPDNLIFLFKTYEKDSCLADARLEIKEIPATLQCPECKHIFNDERFNDHDFAHSVAHVPMSYAAPPCPKCSSNGPEVVAGRELDLVDLMGN